MNRRQFITGLLGAVAAAAVLDRFTDVEVVAPAWSTAAQHLAVGDVFMIDGVYAVNPLTYQPTEFRQLFVITAVTENQRVEERIFPPLVADGPYPTVSNLPADTAALYAMRFHEPLEAEARW